MTITRGFGGKVEQAEPNGADAIKPDNACPLAFKADSASPSWTKSSGDSCVTGQFSADTAGLQVRYGVYSGRPLHAVGTADGIDFSGWQNVSYLNIDICEAASTCSDSAPGVLQVYVTPANGVYAKRNGRALWNVQEESIKVKDTRCPNTLAGLTKYWCATATIPWDDLALPPAATAQFSIAIKLIADGANAGVDPPDLDDANIDVTQKSECTSFGICRPDERAGSVTQYLQAPTQTQNPPPTQPVRFVPGPPTPVTFALSTSFQTPAPLLKAPPPQIEVDAPLANAVKVSGALSQSNATVKSLYTSVSSGMQETMPKNVAPTPPCDSCTNFQSQNKFFNVPTPESTITLIPSAFGMNTVPLKIDNLPDLFGGVALYGSPTSDLMAGVFQAYPNPGPSTDNAVALVRTHGASTLGIIGSTVSRVLPPGANQSVPGTLSVVSLPHVSTYSFVFSDANQTGGARIASNIAPYVRYSYDATDKAGDAVGGVQVSRSFYVHGDDRVTAQAVVGYRADGRNFHVLDGTTPAYPAVSGPLAGIDVAWQGTSVTSPPKLDVSAYTATYASVQDHFGIGDVKIAGAIGKDAEVSYEWSQSRISAALAAVQQLGTSELGDTPYETALAALPPPNLQQTYTTHDQSVALTLLGSAVGGKGGVSVSYNFDLLKPDCTIAAAAVLCSPPGRPTSALSVAAGVSYNNFSLGGAYQPSFFRGARGTSESERVYDVAASYYDGRCTSFVLAASNDANVLSPVAGNVSSNVSAEVDAQLPHDIGNGIMPSVVLGFTNAFGSNNAQYAGTNPVTGANLTLSLPYQAHTYTVYAALRLVNVAYRTTAQSKCTPK
jgi:hypothetical protein